MRVSAKIITALMLVLVMCSCAFADNPGVVMLSTKTCSVCRQMMRVLKNIDENYGGKIDVGMIYLEDKPDIAREFNVMYVPVLLFMDGDGEVIAQEVGYRSAEDIIATFRHNGVKL